MSTAAERRAEHRQIVGAKWRRVRAHVLARDNYTCQIRGPRCTHAATHVDHIVRRRDGGAVLDPANLRASCAACNVGRAVHEPDAFTYRAPTVPMVTRW